MAIFDNIRIEEVSSVIQKKLGLYFPPAKYEELKYKLAEIAKEHNIKDYSFLKNPSEINKNLIKKLAANLTIGETYFWRDRGVFKTLEKSVFPELFNKEKNGNKNIRIWSAGCSSGEEPYSLAILISRLVPDFQSWNITINATDINVNALNKAKKGVYSEWSFRGTPSWLKSDYFTKTGNQYTINKSIRKMVNFSYLNFFEDDYPSLTNDTNSMDLILCRNVFIYFSIEDIKKISDKLYDCLTPKGLLITTPSESFQFLSSRFKIIHLNDTTLYHRRTKEKKATTKKDTYQVPQLDISVDKLKIKAKKLAKKTDKKVLPKISKKQKPKDYKLSEAQVEFDAGKYENALHIINQIHQDSSEQKNILSAKIYANVGRLEEALAECKLALAKNKLSQEAYYLQSTIESEMGDNESAYGSLKKALYINPDHVIGHFNFGNLAKTQSKNAEAKKSYRYALELLKGRDDLEIVPESDGITVGRLKEIVNSLLQAV